MGLFEQAKRMTPEEQAKKSKQIKEMLVERSKRGKIVFQGLIGSVFAGIALTVVIKMRQESQTFPSPTFYAYKRRLLTGATTNEILEEQKEQEQKLQRQLLEQQQNETESKTTATTPTTSILNSIREQQQQPSIWKVLLADQYIDTRSFCTSALIGSTVSLLFFYGVFKRRLITCPNDSYLIVFKRHRSFDFDNGIFNDMLEPGQVRFVRPITEGYGFLTNRDIPVHLKKFVMTTRDNKNVSIDLDMSVGVGKAATEVCFASSKHLNKTPTELANMATKVLQDALQDMVKDLDMAEIEMNSDDFHIHVQQLIAWYMKYIGLYVRECSLLGYEAGHVKVIRRDLKKKGEETTEDDE